MSKYKVGDRVRVLPFEELGARFLTGIYLPSGVAFVSQMLAYCGEELEVEEVTYVRDTATGPVWFYKLSHTNGMSIDWTFTDEMLESVDDGISLDISIAFDDLLR
jgi:hypothetical protein